MFKKAKGIALTLYWFFRVYLSNLYIEWHNRRLENKRRPWTAHRIDGGGVVPLGNVSQEKAISKVSQFGSVRFVDTECAVIMYSDSRL